MGDSYSCILLHIVFTTKFREPILGDDVRQELHAYVATVSRALGCRVVEINSVSDHVHILAKLSRTISVALYLKEIKRKSSRMIREKGGIYAEFSWQAGYGAFSVSRTNMKTIRAYISNQQTHHQTIGFEHELTGLLDNHGIKKET